ncbi:predicted nucleotidyltransferase [Acetobacter aceti NRIC 0242]|uniref:Nucleotidyltransferase n=1 Tax=Acetobacter aceti NBRC 14818 TaxID=887700 RepID=A0AB33IBF7_ACEAC|nr:nucleotidyltransferase domain-containing protein [Acetobacter aceti]TCS34287.1 hypothetical protein EDC15_104233 [Acetobacter aceti NBRC 14818]BCK75427.1 hypothetical protein EMQ_1033 [Acetobacter aceti NBRC 14818]GAN58680.1 hypothetical protein Abac_063_015 [Acetobacter aceti NBRC 14818]GBO81370.1 predicted nucleotidyltransferase [Acetobacter aceti NRIC 0242]
MSLDRLPLINPAIRKEIDQKLFDIEREHAVRILFAVESGSRAWGFPSADSDYDVRFVYVHEEDWYLSLTPGRDVIEQPVTEFWDINGWDIRKALNLLLKPNPVLVEWLSSPVHYRWSDAADQLVALGRKTGDSTAYLHHYLRLGSQQKHLAEMACAKTGVTHYKRLFYALRPAMAIRWIRMKPGVVPPMNFQELCAGVGLNAQEKTEIGRLLALKMKLGENALGPSVLVLDTLIETEFEWAREQASVPPAAGLHAEAETLFRTIVRGPVS